MRCFVHCQATKESQLDNLAHASIERRQSRERIAECNEVVLLHVWQLLHVIEIDVNRTAATFLALPAAGELHSGSVASSAPPARGSARDSAIRHD